jgi:phage gp46-like protein
MDVQVFETLNGGDLQISGSDFVTVSGIENMVYLAMFGGNPGHSTSAKTVEEQSFDWWGNKLLMNRTPNCQFNSITEQTLKNITVTSAGRVTLENAIKQDLKFMNAFAKVTVQVSIVSDERMSASIRVEQKNKSSIVKVVNFKKRLDGDFAFADFNDDFFVG